ncbi:MAG: CBS domain-containing protein [Parasphingorhabdus sp.]|nr:CBS domain-containing protein [Parasphingorhabdus sp.]
MNVREIMTSDPACCDKETSAQDAAQLMVENDCGEIPVVDNERKLVGVVTDRDICCRVVAEGKSPDTRIEDIMTRSAVTVTPDTDMEACCSAMESNKVRRVPVIDDDGNCCGMVSQADIARSGANAKTGELVGEISNPGEEKTSTGCC